MTSSLDSSVKLSKPFSSNTEEEKDDLKKEADLYRGKLESQWDELKSDASGYGKQALVIGGVITGTYLLLRAVLPKEKEKKEISAETVKLVTKKPKPKKTSNFGIGNAVQSLVWTLAVGWARKKLKNYIADDLQSDENSKA